MAELKNGIQTDCEPSGSESRGDPSHHARVVELEIAAGKYDKTNL
jgi:hypothetical protein